MTRTQLALSSSALAIVLGAGLPSASADPSSTAARPATSRVLRALASRTPGVRAVVAQAPKGDSKWLLAEGEALYALARTYASMGRWQHAAVAGWRAAGHFDYAADQAERQAEADETRRERLFLAAAEIDDAIERALLASTAPAAAASKPTAVAVLDISR